MGVALTIRICFLQPTVEFLSTKGQGPGCFEWSPLTFAASNGHYEICRLLLDRGAMVDIPQVILPRALWLSITMLCACTLSQVASLPSWWLARRGRVKSWSYSWSEEPRSTCRILWVTSSSEGQTNGQMGGQTDKWVDRQTIGRTLTDKLVDRQMGRHCPLHLSVCPLICLFVPHCYKMELKWFVSLFRMGWLPWSGRVKKDAWDWLRYFTSTVQPLTCPLMSVHTSSYSVSLSVYVCCISCRMATTLSFLPVWTAMLMLSNICSK